MHKILFAVGGTGGHLFPAQALADQLKEEGIEVLFGGGRLGRNPFFQKLNYPFIEISGESPFRTNPLKATFQLGKGVKQSLKVFEEFSPDLIIGFGSFYSFSLLTAACLKKIPFLLVENNVFPGKVQRLFSRWARLSALQFEETAKYLKGETLRVRMPSQEVKEAVLCPSEAKKYFGLDPDKFTLLIFGGSQGAQKINEAVLNLKLDFPFQVIHLCGYNQDRDRLAAKWEEKGIKACVKHFEDKMSIAWRATDLAICRAGAATLSELIAYEKPAILIPWPGATDKHQHYNAQLFMEKEKAYFLEENALSNLSQVVQTLDLEKIRRRLKSWREQEIEDLCCLVKRQLK